MTDTTPPNQERTPEVILRDWAGQNGEIQIGPILLIAGCWIAMSFGLLPVLIHYSLDTPLSQALGYGATTSFLAALAMIPIGLKGYNRIRLNRVYKAQRLITQDTREAHMVRQVIVAADAIHTDFLKGNPRINAVLIDSIEVALRLVDAVLANSTKPETLRSKAEAMTSYANILKELRVPVFQLAYTKDRSYEVEISQRLAQLQLASEELLAV